MQIAERLAVVANYSPSLPEEVKAQLVQMALEIEKSEQAKQLIQGELPGVLEEDLLSPTYLLIAQNLQNPESPPADELVLLAEQGKTRFLLTACFLASIFALCLVCFFLPKTETSEPRSLAEMTPLDVIGVFLAWDVFGFFGVGLFAALIVRSVDPFILILLTQSALYGLMLVILRKFSSNDVSLGFRKFSWPWVGKGYLLCLLCVFVLNFIISLVQGETPQSENPILELFADAAIWKFALLGLLVVVVGPIFEELMFRAWLFGGLRKRLGDVKAAVISSTIFALIHGDLPGMPALFVLGLVFCWVYRRSGSTIASIIVHGMWNATTFSMLISIMP